MKCPFCKSADTNVKDSRPGDDGRVIRRRRECPSCSKRFTTFERFQVQQLYVKKSDGQRELFETEKLTRSILTALRKRPVSKDTIQNLVAIIEQGLYELGVDEISSRKIGGIVMEKLKDVDFVGYIRYASVYNAFEDLKDFQKLMDDINI